MGEQVTWWGAVLLHKVTQNYGMVTQSRDGAVDHMVSREMSDDITG